MIDCHWYHNDITAYLCCNIANFGVLLNPYASWMNKVDPWYFRSCLIMIMKQGKLRANSESNGANGKI